MTDNKIAAIIIGVTIFLLILVAQTKSNLSAVDAQALHDASGTATVQCVGGPC